MSRFYIQPVIFERDEKDGRTYCRLAHEDEVPHAWGLYEVLPDRRSNWLADFSCHHYAKMMLDLLDGKYKRLDMAN